MHMNVVFIRHNWDSPEYDDINDYLFSSESIGIHFQDISVDPFDPNSYNKNGAARTSIKILNKCDRDETLVVARYKGKKEILVGITEIGSKCVWNSRVEKQIKTLKLKNVKHASFSDFALPFVVAPPFSTIVNWKMGQFATNVYYFGLQTDISVENFLPWQLEILVEEWLRQKNKLEHLIFQTGKYMEDFDIVGLSKVNTPVIAQVKYHSNRKQVEDFFRLVESIPNAKGWFFAGNPGIDSRVSSIEDILLEMDRNYIESLISGKI